MTSSNNTKIEWINAFSRPLAMILSFLIFLTYVYAVLEILKLQRTIKDNPVVKSTILLVLILTALTVGSTPALADAPLNEAPATGLTLLEAWQTVQPAVQQWAADAQLSDDWGCQGVISLDGRCEAWYGLLGSAAQQKAASLKVEGTEVTVTFSAAVNRALAAPFSVNRIMDSPAVAQSVMGWLEAQGLKEAETKIRSLPLHSDPNTLRNCGTSLPLVYQVGLARPQGRVCVNPTTGEVIFNSRVK